jgi:pimeloyl-ACP methyl ester carboxylesterase
MSKSLALVVLAFLMALAAGVVYERIERRNDRERLPRIGRAVEIGGRSLNLYCSGEGAPAVILSTGAPLSGYSWVAVQRDISKFTRACWYDRAGYGWSDPGPDPRDSAASAEDLYQLLQRAEIGAPYILVGESFAAFDMRVYAGRHPKEVAGLVLVNPVRDDEATNQRSRGALPHVFRYPQNLLARALSQVGLVRLLGLGTPRNRFSGRPEKVSDAEWTVISALRNEPKTRTALLQERVEESIAEAHSAGDPGMHPLIGLYSDPPSARLAANEKQVVVEGSRNMIPYFAPFAVVGAVRELCARDTVLH